MKTKILFGIEAVLLCVCLIKCVWHMNPIIITGDSWSIQEDGNIQSQMFSLGMGSYQIRIDYETDQDGINAMKLTGDWLGYNRLKTDTAYFYSNQTYEEVTAWLLPGHDQLYFKTVAAPQGMLQIPQITITETGAMGRVLFCCFLLLFVILDGIYLTHKSWNKKVAACLFGIVAFSSFPLLVDYLLDGVSLRENLLYIEAYARGIQAGYFPVHFPTDSLRQYQINGAVFYGNSCYYLPAVLRLIGFSVQGSYQIFLWIINILTACFSYIYFQRVFKKESFGLLGSFLYSASLYRYYLMYQRADIGDVLAMMFLPIVLLGLYKIYENKKSSWILLGLGMTGVLQSSAICFLMLTGFLLLMTLLHLKSFTQNQGWLKFGKAIVLFGLLNLGYLIPIIAYLRSGNYALRNEGVEHIQSAGMYMEQFLLFLVKAGSSTDLANNGGIGIAPLGMGFALLAGVLLFVYQQIVLGKKDEKRLGIPCLIIGIVSAVMCTNIFPWDGLQKINSAAKIGIAYFQQPWRFLFLVTICFLLVSCVAIERIDACKYRKLAGVILCVIAFFTGSFVLYDMLFMQGTVHYYDTASLINGQNLWIDYNAEKTWIWKAMDGISILTGICTMILLWKNGGKDEA